MFKSQQKILTGENVEIKADLKVIKIDTDNKQTVQSYDFQDLSPKHRYQEIKNKYGTVAVTDEDRKDKDPRSRRFQFNPIVKTTLPIEEEERRFIETQVQKRIDEVVESLRQDAFEKGFSEGKVEGEKKAFEDFKKEGDLKISQVQSLIDSFEGAKNEIYQANEKFIVDLVFRICRMILLKELQVDHLYIARLAKSLIDQVGASGVINVKINPMQREAMESIKSEMFSKIKDLKNLNLEVSEQVQSGGCIVETQWNSINASIDQQMKGLFESLTGQKVEKEDLASSSNQEIQEENKPEGNDDDPSGIN